jgi:hypothetical protein
MPLAYCFYATTMPQKTMRRKTQNQLVKIMEDFLFLQTGFIHFMHI